LPPVVSDQQGVKSNLRQFFVPIKSNHCEKIKRLKPLTHSAIFNTTETDA
jgi:hypothetical protein